MINWVDVHPHDCLILEDGGDYLRIRVAKLQPRIFRKSQRGNWVWISNKADDYHGNKRGMIIKGDPRTSGGTK